MKEVVKGDSWSDYVDRPKRTLIPPRVLCSESHNFGLLTVCLVLLNQWDSGVERKV